MNEITFRWIDGHDAKQEEWDKLDHILSTRGWMALNRYTSRILVAEDSKGQLLSFFVLQLIPHTEPLWVAPSMRSTGLAAEMADRMLEFMQQTQARGWVVIADSPHAAQMCDKYGMKKVESPVYVAV